MSVPIWLSYYQSAISFSYGFKIRHWDQQLLALGLQETWDFRTDQLRDELKEMKR